jgi:hypothetical protein
MKSTRVFLLFLAVARTETSAKDLAQDVLVRSAAKGDVKLDEYSRAHLVDLDARITKALDASVVMPRP